MKALILVDIQNDFLPGGALPVPEGNAIIPQVNALMNDFDLIVASKDWHPANHGSFAKNHPGDKIGEVVELNGINQILWPVHCVENTKGAEFAADLNTDKIDKVFYKGTDPLFDSYSTFFDNGKKRATGLEDFLKEKGVKEVYVTGLATEYCVKYTVLDAIGLGFDTFVIKNACRGIDPADCEKAFEEMEAAGAYFIE